MDEIKLNLENLTEEERKTLMKLVEKGNKPKPKRCKPQEGEQYWFVDTDGMVNSYVWNNSSFCNDMFAFNNCHPTEEETEVAAKKKRVIAKMEIFAEEHNECEIDWRNDNQPKYTVNYDYSYPNLRTCKIYHTLDLGAVYFTSEEVAQACINELGDEIIAAFVEG